MQYRVNVSLDDVSPHPQSSTKVLDRCYELLKHFPSMKFSLFVPVAYWRTIGPTATEKPLIISEFPAFCETLRQLSKESFEVCYHGLFHGIPGRSNNDELQHLSYDEALGVIEDMDQVVHMAGLDDVFKRVLRPPAWRMSPGAIRAAHDKGFTLALNSIDYAMATYQGEHERLQARVVWQTANPPFKQLVLEEKTELVYHAIETDKNYLSIQLAEELVTFLKDKDVEFCFIEELL